jgi:hypothetical protein
MREHYRKHFKVTQAVIFLATAAAYFFFGRRPEQAATLFVFMQFSAAVGALWSARFATLTQRHPGRLVRR